MQFTLAKFLFKAQLVTLSEATECLAQAQLVADKTEPKETSILHCQHKHGLSQTRGMSQNR